MQAVELAKEVKDFLEPSLSKIFASYMSERFKYLLKKINNGNAKQLKSIDDKIALYATRLYERCSIASTLVFPNKQKLLNEIYIPLSISNEQGNSYKIDNNSAGIFNQLDRIIIIDNAGMGKSTLLKKLCISVLEEGIRIPFYIELRKISRQKPLVDFILDQIGTISSPLDMKTLLHLIKGGELIFLLDGYDEIAPEERPFVNKAIRDFVLLASECKFVLTSRPELELTSYADFMAFRIKPLSKDEAFSLIKKYDYKGSLHKELIKSIKSSTNTSLSEFLTNPLLVSLLYSAFEYKSIIPIKKHIFYRNVYDSLYESHDLSKGDSFVRKKYSGLDIEEFHLVLRHLGYFSFIKYKVEFQKEELVDYLKKIKKFIGNLDFKETDFVNDLIITVPVFVKDGFYYRWMHKSIQEYFAAHFIFLDSRDKQDEILLKLSFHDNIDMHINVLDLYFSIDYKSFNKVVIFELVNRFIQMIENSFKKFKDSHGKLNLQSLTFNHHYFIVRLPEELVYSFETEDVSVVFSYAEGFVFPNDNYHFLYEFNQNGLAVDEGIICLLRSEKKVFRLIKFLHNKNEKLFKKVSFSKFEIDKLPKLLPGLYEITENFESMTEENIYAVSAFMGVNTQYNSGYVLDEKLCRKRISDIQKIVKIENQNDLLAF